MSDERRATRVKSPLERGAAGTDQRRIVVLTVAAFAVPITTVLALRAVEDSGGLTLVVIGAGIVTLVTPWLTSGWGSRPTRADHARGEDRDARSTGSH